MHKCLLTCNTDSTCVGGGKISLTTLEQEIGGPPLRINHQLGFRLQDCTVRTGNPLHNIFLKYPLYSDT